MRIAVFTKNRLNPAYAGARLGADRAAARMGAQTAHYVPETPDDPVKQSALIEQALRDKPDAIVLVPVHPIAVNEAILRINDAGVPLIGFINRLTEGRCVSFVSSDDYALAFAVARYVFERLGGSGKVVLVEGPEESVTGKQRSRAFRDAALEHPGISIVGSCRGAFLQEPAKEAVARLLDETPDIDALMAANDSMALGALEALDAAGRGALVSGINAVPEAIDAIKRGAMIATADFSALNMGYVATECAIRHLRGETVPSEIMLPAALVDASNCSLWDKPFEEREFPEWDDVLRGQQAASNQV